MNTKHTVNLPNFGGGFFNGGALASEEHTTWGWLVGLGTEWMITPNWTAFIEYNYIEFDKKNEAFPLSIGNHPLRVTLNADITNKLSIAKVGVNYKFDWGTLSLRGTDLSRLENESPAFGRGFFVHHFRITLMSWHRRNWNKYQRTNGRPLRKPSKRPGKCLAAPSELLPSRRLGK